MTLLVVLVIRRDGLRACRCALAAPAYTLAERLVLERASRVLIGTQLRCLLLGQHALSKLRLVLPFFIPIIGPYLAI